MKPREIAFTDSESNELGLYLDQFVAAGAPNNLPPDLYRDVQVLVARKIWQIRPDISAAIQVTGSDKYAPAVLIGNVPVDKSLPQRPDNLYREKNVSDPVFRSDYFNIGVGLIRYGEVMPASHHLSAHVTVTSSAAAQMMHHLKTSHVRRRAFHRDRIHHIRGNDIRDDMSLHTLKGDSKAKTYLACITDLPDGIIEYLRKPRSIGDSESIIIENEGLRFNPHFDNDMLMTINGSTPIEHSEVVLESFRVAGERDAISLNSGDYLLIDQSRVFHATSGHDVEDPYNSRWVIHARWKKPDGKEYKTEDKEDGVIYKLPNLIDEPEVLKQISDLSKKANIIKY